MENGFYKLTEEEWHRLHALSLAVRGTGIFLNGIELRFLHQEAKEAIWNFGEELTSISRETLEILNNVDERNMDEMPQHQGREEGDREKYGTYEELKKKMQHYEALVEEGKIAKEYAYSYHTNMATAEGFRKIADGFEAEAIGKECT